MSEAPKRLLIENKARGPVGEKQFLKQLQQAILGGYRLAENDHIKDCSMCNYLGFINRAVLYTPGYEPLEDEPKGFAREFSSLEKQPKVLPVEIEPIYENNDKAAVTDTEEVEKEALESDTDPLANLTKKVDLIKYAESLGIEIPDGMNQPVLIKKFIKDQQTP